MPTAGVPANQTQNALTNTDLTAGCAATWYAPRCNPKFDPFAANAVLSEILNLVNCCNLEYDCTRLDNMCRAVQRCIQNTLFGCLPQNFPLVTNPCAIEQLVLQTDAEGCRSIARYSASASQLGGGSTCHLQAPGTSQVMPADPANAATWYGIVELRGDYDTNTINEAKLTPNLFLDFDIDVPCDNTEVEFSLGARVVFASGNPDSASILALRIDNNFVPVANVLLTIGSATNYDSRIIATQRHTFATAGVHRVRAYVVHDEPSGTGRPAQLVRGCSPAGNSGTGTMIARVAIG